MGKLIGVVVSFLTSFRRIEHCIKSPLSEDDLKKELPRLFKSNKGDVLHLLQSSETLLDGVGPEPCTKFIYQGFRVFIGYEGETETMERLLFSNRFSRRVMTPEETNEFLMGLGFAPIRPIQTIEGLVNSKSYYSSFKGVAVKVLVWYSEEYKVLAIKVNRTTTEQQNKKKRA